MDAPSSTIRLAKRLRRSLTPPEALLWMALKQGGGGGLKFRRQHPIGPYVLDFYCHSLRLAIEVDGLAHDTGNRPQRDAARDRWLAGQGIRVIRIPADQVMRDATGVIDGVIGLATNISSPTGGGGPRSGGGGGRANRKD